MKKTRWINCRDCHGKGERYYSLDKKWSTCVECDGRGQVEETYYEICPNCHGDYAKYSSEKCKKCGGKGTLACGECHGKGEIECKGCNGKGRVQCSHCKGSGSEQCPDCEKREREAKERRERKEREERNRRIEAREKKEAAEKAAQERKEMALGCGCLLAIVALVGFLVWWWMEGFTRAGLSNIGLQIKQTMGGLTGLGNLAKIGGVLIALWVAWKMIRGKKGEESTSTKKRWKFVVLGLLLGFIGVHFAYAKRWFLFLLLWASFITGGIASDKNADAEKRAIDTSGTQVEQQTESKSENNGSMVENIGFAAWLLLWIGGALFVKKDGKGNRM